MVRAIDDPSERLRQLGQSSRGEVDFSRFLSDYGALRDNVLAELIEQDGRMRLVRGKSVTLERYIDAIPNLLDRPDPLDAAIDVTLRSLSRSSHPDDEAIDKLIARYPQLADSIEEAAALNNALWSTTGLRRKISEQTTRTLPEEFGPPVSGAENGESRYVLQRLLGTGAYGRVYLAVDRQLSDDGHPAMVAVKILSSDDRSTPSRHALAEEATKARRIDHPYVVRVLDRGISGCNEDYIVYEYVDGGDLGRWLRNQREPIPLRRAVRMAAQIARGVQAAHAAGLVHCDLKPGNIMLKGTAETPARVNRDVVDGNTAGFSRSDESLTDTVQPKVADFGIAIRSGESLPALQDDDQPRHPIGNLAYISPEQYRMEEGALTVPSDVYAIGGILFTLLTGELPNGSTVEEIAETHHPEFGRSEPPRLRPLRPDIDADLEAICRRAMAVRPEDRYSAAGTLADDLEAWLRHEPIYWTNPSALRLISLWVRRRPTMAASLLIGTLLLTAGATLAGYYAIQARESAALALQHEQQKIIEQLRADQERLRADQEAKLNAMRIEWAERIQNSLYEVAMTSPTTTQTLSYAWVFNHLFDASAMEIPGDTPSFEDARMRTIQNKLDRLAAEGRGQSLEARLWQTNILFWLIGRGQLEEAKPMLRSLKVGWQAILDPGDPWLELFEVFEAALLIQETLAAGGLDANGPDRDALLHAEDVLIRYEQAIDRIDPGTPAHYLALEALEALYSPPLFDQPDRHESMAQRQRELSRSDRAQGATKPSGRRNR